MRSRIVFLCLVVAVLSGVTSTAATAARRTSSGCGRSARPGVTTRDVVVDQQDREYLVSVPAGYQPSKPAPLVFDFHGLGSNMQEQSLYTNLAVTAGARGYVVITPDGQGSVLRHWSLTPASAANPDVAFVQAMLRETARILCIDHSRVFATGISNGAMFSMVLACALPGRFAAVAPVAGVNATAACSSGTPPVSVLAFHGTADPIVPYEGGAYFSGRVPVGALGIPSAKPVDRAVAAWAALDGCGSSPSTTDLARDVQRVVWPRCPSGVAVELYRVVGGGHTWPGAVAVGASRLGATTASIGATTLTLDFFDSHAPS